MFTITNYQFSVIFESKKTNFVYRLKDFLQEQFLDVDVDKASLPIDTTIERVLSIAESIGATSERNVASCVILYLLAHSSDNTSQSIDMVDKILSETIHSIEKRIEEASKIFEK